MSGKNRKRQEAKDLQGDALSNDMVPEPKMEIKAKILDGNTIEKAEKVDKTDAQLIHSKRASARIVEKRVAIGWVISRLDMPVNVEYDGNVMRVSPRAKLKIADHTKLGKLPTGLVLKK